MRAQPLFQSELRTADFDFDLPPERIAQMPVTPRDRARLLQVTQSAFSDHHMVDLPSLLRAGDLLVMNDTKVIPARLYGKRGEVEIEILLHKKQSPQTWLVLAKPGKRLHAGDRVAFAPDFSAEILEKRADGEILIRFSAADEKLPEFLETHGYTPLPPYIRRDKTSNAEDRTRYQTIYAAREGAIAAPTAGLHFTPELLANLAARGIECASITLHVGAGTFLPVKAELLRDHVMHSEWGEIAPGIAAYINKAKREGRRIVAVGTTSLRLLEAAVDAKGMLHPFAGETDIFIYPGYQFRIADALLTNFHLPQSTLFMLVAAFAGLERMKEAYAYAIAQNYRFYSYGDATLLERA